MPDDEEETTERHRLGRLKSRTNVEIEVTPVERPRNSAGIDRSDDRPAQR